MATRDLGIFMGDVKPNMTSGNTGAQSTDSGKDYRKLIEYSWVLGVIFLCSGCAYALVQSGRLFNHVVHSANIVMIYLLGVLLVATRSTRGPAVFCALASVVAFDFWFVEPVHSLYPRDRAYVMVVLVMLIVALLVNELSQRAIRTNRLLEKTRLEAESEKLKNTLLRSVSHDLKTPLAAIMGASSSLLSESSQQLSSPVKAELTASIFKESQRLERLVSNLLEMTRIEAGNNPLHKEWNSAEDLVGSALSALELQLGQKEIDIHLDSDLPLVLVDDVLMEQVLLNLLDNCIKYAPDGSYGISAQSRGDYVQVSVRNSGSSIPENARERVFEKFYRADDQVRGSGLGLAICRGIIQLHGGRIWVDSESSSDGADFVTVSFTIPVPKEQPMIEENV